MKFYKPVSKFHIATFIALLFHISGCIGIFTNKKDWFISNTPLNLMLMFGLIFWTHEPKERKIAAFFFICFVVGMVTEMIGVHTGLLFGHYKYGSVLGPKLLQVPYLIGINWFVIMYTSAMSVIKFHKWIEVKFALSEMMLSPKIKSLSLVLDGAILAVFFDFIMEPVAVKLGYWSWLGNGDIPFFNYLCWFVISMGLLYVFTRLTFKTHNLFAVHLFIIQLLFFGVLRTFL